MLAVEIQTSIKHLFFLTSFCRRTNMVEEQHDAYPVYINMREWVHRALWKVESVLQLREAITVNTELLLWDSRKIILYYTFRDY